jgi:DNA-binding ferritin-like protein
MHGILHEDLYMLIASMMVLRQKTHSTHWIVNKTESFMEIHKLLNKQYDQILENFDRVAEYLVIHRKQPPLTLTEAIENSFIEEEFNDYNTINMLKELANDNYIMSKEMSLIKCDDRVIDNILAELQEYHDKQYWFLRSYYE